MTPEQVNTIINGIIYKYSRHLGQSHDEAIKNAETFFIQFQKEIKQHEESIQLGQDDQIAEELI